MAFESLMASLQGGGTEEEEIKKSIFSKENLGKAMAARKLASAVGVNDSGALGGAASGALTGAQLGAGPAGAIVGGAVGGLSGILKSKSKKKQREREAQAQHHQNISAIESNKTAKLQNALQSMASNLGSILR